MEKFTELFETTGQMPSFKEVAEVSLTVGMERRYVFGQGMEHLDNAPFKIRLLRKNPNDPHEPVRYAMCYCGCPSCRPQDWEFSMPPEPELSGWRKRAAELAPLGREGFFQLIAELRSAGHPIAGQVSMGMNKQ